MSLRLNTKSMPAREASRKKMTSQMSVATTPPPELMYCVRTGTGYFTKKSDSAKLPMKATNMVATIAAVGEGPLSLTCERRYGSSLSHDMAKMILEGGM